MTKLFGGREREADEAGTHLLVHSPTAYSGWHWVGTVAGIQECMDDYN